MTRREFFYVCKRLDSPDYVTTDVDGNAISLLVLKHLIEEVDACVFQLLALLVMKLHRVTCYQVAAPGDQYPHVGCEEE